MRNNCVRLRWPFSKNNKVNILSDSAIHYSSLLKQSANTLKAIGFPGDTVLRLSKEMQKHKYVRLWWYRGKFGFCCRFRRSRWFRTDVLALIAFCDDTQLNDLISFANTREPTAVWVKVIWFSLERVRGTPVRALYSRCFVWDAPPRRRRGELPAVFVRWLLNWKISFDLWSFEPFETNPTKVKLIN